MNAMLLMMMWSRRSPDRGAGCGAAVCCVGVRAYAAGTYGVYARCGAPNHLSPPPHEEVVGRRCETPARLTACSACSHNLEHLLRVFRDPPAALPVLPQRLAEAVVLAEFALFAALLAALVGVELALAEHELARPDVEVRVALLRDSREGDEAARVRGQQVIGRRRVQTLQDDDDAEEQDQEHWCRHLGSAMSLDEERGSCDTYRLDGSGQISARGGQGLEGLVHRESVKGKECG